MNPDFASRGNAKVLLNRKERRERKGKDRVAQSSSFLCVLRVLCGESAFGITQRIFQDESAPFIGAHRCASVANVLFCPSFRSVRIPSWSELEYQNEKDFVPPMHTDGIEE